MNGTPAKDDPNTGLTVSGHAEALGEFLRSAAAKLLPRDDIAAESGQLDGR
jgi:hypothetical protein